MTTEDQLALARTWDNDVLSAVLRMPLTANRDVMSATYRAKVRLLHALADLEEALHSIEQREKGGA